MLTNDTLPYMTEKIAFKVITSVMQAASREGLSIAVAVVDSAGQLFAFQQSRDAFPASIELSIAKAKTSAKLRRTLRICSITWKKDGYLIWPYQVHYPSRGEFLCSCEA
ncbi:hypothetical protein CLI92_02460 [Vandammella animalimorsus]|uniref:Heme-binding protein n=1 Tax=Vandammella animalimorsus TaxID=2029117 RepID=A0A2A2T968_9BURK|nr:hypothetical protein CK626_08740 [Vandammella animalimorsus]PAX18672.1 hypothetical protein CLI92_02460 [Vandammella animalimorsus]PAX20835.1 hypothetical protein CLI93_03885 [Vandammella animalimorsus]